VVSIQEMGQWSSPTVQHHQVPYVVAGLQTTVVEPNCITDITTICCLVLFGRAVSELYTRGGTLIVANI